MMYEKWVLWEVLRSGMGKQVVRCIVCTRVHDLRELLDTKKFPNGTTTFTCPVKSQPGSYKLENVGTINPNQT